MIQMLRNPFYIEWLTNGLEHDLNSLNWETGTLSKNAFDDGWNQSSYSQFHDWVSYGKLCSTHKWIS